MNNDWIEINLPWNAASIFDLQEQKPIYPHDIIDSYCINKYGEGYAAVCIDINKEIENLPEVKLFETLSESYNERRECFICENSFFTNNLCRPGVLIEVQFNDCIKSKRQLLLGHINCNADMYSAYEIFNGDVIVLRAKIICELKHEPEYY